MKLVPTLYFPASPARFQVKASSAADESSDGKGETVKSLTLKEFVESKVPSLLEGYRPSWWLRSGHLQTAYVVSGNFTNVDKVVYERVLLRVPDGGTLGLDSTPKEATTALPDDTPIVVVSHGLTGGSHESYVRSILAGACAPKSDGGLGYRGIVVNFRGCAGIPLTSPQLYSGGHTDDLRCALLYISGKYPKAPLLGLGFSLGANVMTRYLGEEGERSLLRSGFALACPWDLLKNSQRLETEFIPKHIYSKAMGSNLLALFNRHLDTFKSFPDSVIAVNIPKVLSLVKPALIDMDSNMTILIGGTSPPFPFSSANEYYVWASSHKAIHTIRVPFLAINAADDPIVGFVPTEEVEHSTSAALVVTQHGGHLGWFQDGSPLGGGPPPDRWVRRPALEWLRAVGEDFVPDLKNARKLGSDRIERDGFTLEKGKDLVGYRIVGKGEMVEGASDVPDASGATQGL